jgi:hypothetical protein
MRRRQDSNTAGPQAVLGAVFPVVVDQFTIKHGPPPGTQHFGDGDGILRGRTAARRLIWI